MKYRKQLPAGFLLLVILLAAFTAGNPDENLRYRRIKTALDRFTKAYPQQKVFLHTDRATYRGGNTLWFKAYLVNALSHFPDTISTNLYVELISPFHTRVEIKRIQLFRGFGAGDFTLSDTLPEGLYQLRAYTSWMLNFDPAFQFRKNFQLINPAYSRHISPREARGNKRKIDNMPGFEEDIDLQFMPEGGYLVEGIESVVAFKAINKLGKGVDVDGIITDDQGNRIASFTSYYKGIGTFLLKPEKGVRYFAHTQDDGKTRKTALPQPLETGLVMRTDLREQVISVTLESNAPATADPSAREIIVTGQTGGKMYFHATVKLNNNSAQLKIPEQVFPSGIMQLTAFSGRGVPLAERLVFVGMREEMKIRFFASDTFTREGKMILLEINTRSADGRPVPADFSLSVTREMNLGRNENKDNICSNLFLTSDLKGFVEDPLEYFKPGSPEASKAVDNLMLTQGWRRFDWSSLLAGDYPEIRYFEEKGISVYGKITRDFFNIPLKNCKVQLSVMDAYNDVFTQQTSDEGTFLFENMVYYDTIKVKIEAWRPSGRRNLVIVVPDDGFAEVTGQQGDYSLITQSERDNKAYRHKRAEEFKKATAEEQKRLKEERNTEIKGIYGEPDNVIRSEDFSPGHTNVLEALKGRVPGMQINGNRVLIRGPNSFYGSNQPLFLLDGLPVMDVSTIQSIPVEDIDRVEILKGPSAAIYGSRGANGVVAVYTKRGRFMKRGVIEFEMLGYSAPRVFYEPKYKPGAEPEDNYTVYWDPDIRTNTAGKARVLFNKPEIEGNYRFDLQGISYSGHAAFVDTVIYSE
ncbi:MAG: TonB-dependent receptor plug domain-containing protein [Bacteroidales bacterium]